jgi:hypothetical protein
VEEFLTRASGLGLGAGGFGFGLLHKLKDLGESRCGRQEEGRREARCQALRRKLLL